MPGVRRFSVSLEKDLSGQFDLLIKQKKCNSRSEAFRKLIKQELVQEEWLKGRETAGAIVLVYDHHKKELLNKITHIQHDYSGVILSTQHVHLDHHNCLEVIIIKGKPREVHGLRDKLKIIRGIKCSSLAMASTGKEIP